MEHRVTPLELFFDLVFVFAFTQVTALLLENETWIGFARGLLVLGVLWWAWASYAWLTNAVDADAGLVIAAVLAAMAAMFVAALAVPDAFGRHRVVFAVAFLIVLVMYLALFALAVKGEPDLLAAVLRNARPSMVGAALILAAAFVGGGIRPLLWLAALAVGLFGGLFSSLSGWRVHPAHFAERHGLILIIALGESLGAIGFGARDTGLTLGVILAAVLGLAIAASFWLAYFDFAAFGVERLVADRGGERQIALARDVYSYLHLPMVAGIVLFAFAMRRTLADVHAELHWIPALALCGGCALYVFAYVLLRLRVSRSVGRGRAAATVAFMLLLPVAVSVPGLAALALVVAVWVALHAYELIWWRQARAETRALRTPARTA
jgi:low temperature requirement protein LtrA